MTATLVHVVTRSSNCMSSFNRLRIAGSAGADRMLSLVHGLTGHDAALGNYDLFPIDAESIANYGCPCEF